MSHTPGPWKYQLVHNGFGTPQCIVFAPDGREISRMYIIPNADVEADFRLIAAAPDLLAALRECLEVLGGHYTYKRPFMDRAHAAICRATGEEL